MPQRARGFTLIEMIVSMVIVAVIAGFLGSYMQPLIRAHVDAQARAELADQLDLAIRGMQADVRRGVPNAIRAPGANCIELVPTKGGGRYRMGPDVSNDTPAGCASGSSATCSAWVDTSDFTAVFDALNVTGDPPAANDWIVIGNQNGNDVHEGSNRTRVSSVQVPLGTQGQLRVNVASTQFHPGYAEGRFQTISASEPVVAYACVGTSATLDARGNGQGTLLRIVRNFSSAYPSEAACASTAGALQVSTVARRVVSCHFLYDPNAGATQQAGFVWLELELSRNQERARLAVGAHVSNVP